MNNEFVKELNGKEYHFKFTSKKCIDLEKVTGKQFIDLLKDTSMGNIVRLLKAACLETCDEYEILDAFLAEMSLEKVMLDVIYEIASISGIISKEDKAKVDEAVAKAKSDATEELNEKK